MKTKSSNPASNNKAFLLVDGPNLDGAIAALLGRKPTRDDRPDFSVFAQHIELALGARVGCKAYVTLRGSDRASHAFQATLRGSGFGWKVIASERRMALGDADPSDQAALDALRVAQDLGYREYVVVTHDHGFCPALTALVQGGARVTVCSFLELLHRDYDALAQAGASIVDLREIEPRFRPLDPRAERLEDLIDPPDAA
ncbi:MAG: NYN domain-containing protein [Planctomycetes bacterium]|nr:NYN domain-containing protein [Planctomycetota bacterium]